MMKKTKKLLAVMVTAAMAVSLYGCSEKEETKPADTAKETSVAEGTTGVSTEIVANEAADWKPDRDITIRVPNAAGGTMDTLTRIFGQGLQETYGKTVMVNNLTGANGAIAANDLLAQDVNACEMMAAGINLFTLAPLFNKEVNVNLDDFKIVTALVSEDFLLCTAPGNSGITTWEELQQYGSKERIVFGSNTPGGTTHMLATALFGEASMEAEAITSDGSVKDLLALLSGDVVCAVVAPSVAEQYVIDGSVVPLAVFSEEPYHGFPELNVPTVQSLGYDIVFRSCNFIMTKADVDQAVVDQIYESYLAYQQTDSFKEMAANAKFIPDTSNGEEVRKTIEESAMMCQKIYDKYYQQ